MNGKRCYYQYTHTHIHTHTMEYDSALKNNETLSFAVTWMDVEGIILSEISQSEKDKYHMVSLLCEIKKKLMLVF